MLVKTFGGAIYGVDAQLITIEVNLAQGINFYLVGLPDSAVKESQQRIKSALSNNGYRIPGKEITINMAPADIRKEGASYDLAIAVGILAASEQISAERIGDYLLVGELSLDGTLKPIRGVLPIALCAKSMGFKGVIVPTKNRDEAAVVEGIHAVGVDSILDTIDFLEGKSEVPIEPTRIRHEDDSLAFLTDFNEVKGQMNIKRAFEIAAAGGHNVILIGPPGAGKSMLAKRLPSILPPMTTDESLETTKIHSVVGKVSGSGLVTKRPFRKPHHTISDVALVGGGSYPQPGEISLAHNGVLFLDELPEYQRSVLEVMRQPMEDRMVTISRARLTVDFPTNFMLVAAMNPCPCGYYNHPERECSCGSGVVERYLNKVSGPLLDRIDLHIDVTPVSYDELEKDVPSEGSADIRKRVMKARNVQSKRFLANTALPKEMRESVHCNSDMTSKQVRSYCQLDDGSATILRKAMEKMGFSARAYDRILKVARTIADLDGQERIGAKHIAEAVQYRSLDKR